MGSKKRKGSTAMMAVVHQAHKERTDVNVDGSIAGGARVVDAAAIKGANAAGDSTIKVNVANTTNMAAAGNAVATIAAAAGDAVAATMAAAGNGVKVTTDMITTEIKSMAPGLTYLFFSWRWQLPS